MTLTQWREEDHPRDDEGKFTCKNGGGITGSVIKGGIEKYEFPNGGGENDGGVLGGIGGILGGVLGVILNPAEIQAVLGILAAKYTIKKI